MQVMGRRIGRRCLSGHKKGGLPCDYDSYALNHSHFFIILCDKENKTLGEI